jgi:integrase
MPIDLVGRASAQKRSSAKVLEAKTFRDGAIYLYRRSDYKKPTWFIRLKIPGAKGYIWQSSKTTEEHAAYKVADDLFNKYLVKVLGGGKLGSKKITDALNSYIRRFESEQSRLSIKYKIFLAKRLMPIFQGKTFEDLDTALISKMVTELNQASTKEKLSPNTIKRIFADFRTFLNWCVEEGYLPKVPTFPKIKAEQSRRPHFDINDYRKLTRHLREYVKHANPAVVRDRTLVMNYVLILANTGIRVGEARTLKWRDLRPIHSPEEPSVINLALTVNGKTGKREVVAGKAEVKSYFARILELRKLDITNPKSDLFEKKDVPSDSYVFCGVDGKPINSFKKSFITLLTEAKVLTDSYGQRRSIYSLRHTYATARLQEGVNQYILAKNMGTSVAMLEAFYGHTSNVTSVDELTKYTPKKKKSGGEKKPKEAFAWLKDDGEANSEEASPQQQS